MSHAHNFKDLTGMRFGRLTVLSFEETSGNRASLWRVRCDCGTEFIAYGTHLRRGLTRSCGCLRTERVKEINRQRKING